MDQARARSVVRLDVVGVRFPRRDEPAIQGVSLSVARGEQVIIFGPSGAGKSTLLQTIMGVVPHSVTCVMDGVVTIAGKTTTDTAVVDIARHLGVLTQDPSASVCLPDVEQELALPLENRAVPPDEIGQRIDAVLAAVNASDLRAHRTARLSGGEEQRIGLAAALVGEPQLLILDEPTSMLDAAGVTSVRDAIGRAVARYAPTVLLVEHRIDDFAGPEGLSGLPARAIILDDHGRILDDGPTKDVLKRSAVHLLRTGCWLPLETELQAVFEEPGGLESPHVRGALMTLANATFPRLPFASTEPRAVAADVILSAKDLSVARTAPMRRHRTRRVTRKHASGTGAQIPEHPLIRRATFDLHAGEIVALLGGNGTGKTTLLLTLAGLLPSTSGTVDGSRPGMVFQNPEHQFIANTVRDEIAHGLSAHSGPLVERLLTEHRLEHLAGQNPFRLSGGEKRRLSVAAMLAHQRPVLLADEPTFGLDRRDTIATLRALRGLAAQGQGVIFSSHDLRTVTTLAHRVLVVADRQIIADGPVYEVLRDKKVLRLAGLTLPPLIQWLLDHCQTGEQVQAVLDGLDNAALEAVDVHHQSQHKKSTT